MNLKETFSKILGQELEKANAQGGKYSRRFARRRWRDELGDSFMFRGVYFKGGGHVSTFREWQAAQ